MKLLITGSNGLLGQKLAAALRDRPQHSVIATSLHPNRVLPLKNSSFEILDITQKNDTDSCIAKHRPDVVIHTAAMTLVDACEQDREACWKINVTGTENILRASEKNGAHFIHLSTDFIFDGTDGPYREDAAPHPLNYYGTSKLAAEKLVQESQAPWTILRTILVYGVTPQMARSNIVLFVKNNLEQRKPIRVVEDQFRMPTLAEDLAWACLQAAENKTKGIFNISGNDLVSIYQFANLAAEIFGLDKTLISPVKTAALQEPAKRPPRTGFVLDKASETLHYRPHSLQEGLRLVRDQFFQN